ncbi:MAG TPA: UDP-3-O-(3-hydroxymyristoyl)glucosamine N-acyltransferase [Staphylococcus sp.]|nr:UDP-3-O-(3-hydroxymyristoyl)glucosamine N-acyltransferase [Staphylococcus sp.]
MRKSISVKEILTYLTDNNYTYQFEGNKTDEIKGYSTLFNYIKETMTFVSTLNEFKDYQPMFTDKNINLILCGYDENNINCANNIIKTQYPKKMFFDILDAFYGEESNTNNLFEFPDKSKSTFISNKAIIGENVKIGHGCVIEDNVIIGDNTTLHHNVIIRNNTKTGQNCTICSGTVIGETGFNPLRNINEQRTMVKHYGGVLLEDDVHIGDNCTISKGTIDDTVIRAGVKINKQVVIAHNVHIEVNTVITTPTFIAGSVKIGANCHIAATSIRNQCVIGDGATLGLGSVVVNDVKENETVVGIPAKPLNKRGR